jgi:hypothetical protein
MHMTQFVFLIVAGYIFVTREGVDCVVVLSARKVSRSPFWLPHLSLQRIVLYGMSPWVQRRVSRSVRRLTTSKTLRCFAPLNMTQFVISHCCGLHFCNPWGHWWRGCPKGNDIVVSMANCLSQPLFWWVPSWIMCGISQSNLVISPMQYSAILMLSDGVTCSLARVLYCEHGRFRL